MIVVVELSGDVCPYDRHRPVNVLLVGAVSVAMAVLVRVALGVAG